MVPHSQSNSGLGTFLFSFLISVLLLGCSGGGQISDPSKMVFHLGNGEEIEDVDPHTSTGVTEHNVIGSLFEGLVNLHPETLEAEPGVAERWTISEDGTEYTFHLRDGAQWSNGDALTAKDFYDSFQRILTPSLAAEYANMLFVVENAEDFYRGRISDFTEVGFDVPDPLTLKVTLRAPIPYFLNMLGYHYSWWAVHIPTVSKFGGMERKGTDWTRPENIVSNGPFILNEWRVNQYISVVKNTNYWDAANVKLDEVKFFHYGSLDTEERAFRGGQLHVTYDMLRPKIPWYQENNSEVLQIDDYLGVYFYRVNVNQEHLKDKRVRQALALSINRKQIVEGILKDGSKAAFHIVPKNTAGFLSEATFEEDLEKAKSLLAEAGYPNGEGFPGVEIMFNTQETHKSIAEAVQQMWKKGLGINATLANQEWKVYLDMQDTLDYQISRSGWIGDYIDPNTFLEMWKTGDGNNDTGWSNQAFDRLIDQAATEPDNAKRYSLFQDAEKILMEEMPVIPIYHYAKPYLKSPKVKGWHGNLLSHHPLKHVYLTP